MRLKTTSLTLGAVGLIVIMTASTALAADVNISADPATTSLATANTVVDDISHLGGDVRVQKGTTSTDPDTAISASVAGTAVDVPADPQAGVAVAAAADPADSMVMGLPVNEITKDAKVVDGTAVYQQTGSDVAVQPLVDGGVRALVTVVSANAPHDYAFPFTLPAGVHPELTSGGGIDFVATEQAQDADHPALDARPVFGHLDAPWAKDANGTNVVTTYTVSGDTVTQHIAFDASTAFPVVADPKLQWHWWGPALKFSYAETGKARNKYVLVGMLSGFCWAFGVETLGAACGIVAVETGGIAAVASNAYGDHKCLEVRYGLAPFEVGC